MVYIAKIAINTNGLHCKIYFDVDHKTIRQLMMPKRLDEVFQWFVTPFCCCCCCLHSVIYLTTTIRTIRPFLLNAFFIAISIWFSRSLSLFLSFYTTTNCSTGANGKFFSFHLFVFLIVFFFLHVRKA